MSLKEGITIERLPHQLRVFGGKVLSVVPGRPPLCLRRKKAGHIRKDCRVLHCHACHGFGFVYEECPRAYVAAVWTLTLCDTSGMQMDEAEAEATTAGIAVY